MSETMQKQPCLGEVKGSLEQRIAQLRDRKPVYLNHSEVVEMQNLAAASFQEHPLAVQLTAED